MKKVWLWVELIISALSIIGGILGIVVANNFIAGSGLIIIGAWWLKRSIPRVRKLREGKA